MFVQAVTSMKKEKFAMECTVVLVSKLRIMISFANRVLAKIACV